MLWGKETEKYTYIVKENNRAIVIYNSKNKETQEPDMFATPYY